ncbi:hypothetical protein COU55_02335 [Candidatus Pacearchaeota archaeon CG10_big_fil_rev_8_21_14_0_10_31_59]|nr:MAG: hypothetical protein COU55_02335 [Candidatus Pacearchaeota archaeon CG10_big_fil_rev_8_21_14_0_10_31_59]
MKMKNKNWIGVLIGLALIIIDFFVFRKSNLFFFLLGLAVVIIVLPFIANFLIEAGRAKEKEEKFLEFARNLVESVNAGTPISKSIINVADKDYGSLSLHIKKLANQINLGIPVRKALEIFARDTKNKVIARSVDLIGEAEQSGGEIGTIIEAVAKSVREIEDIKKERKSGMFNMVVQGYIIFFIFIIIMLVVQYKFIPLMMETLKGLSGSQISMFSKVATESISTDTLNILFLVLLIVQGLFTGLVIGKLAEGKIKSGIKHSLIMIALAYLITTGIKALL